MAAEQNHSTVVSFGEDVLERMVLAVEQVRDRLRRATAALEAAGVPYAVIGGNAVAAWVSRIDPAAVRITADVDVLVARVDFERMKAAMEAAGFVYRHVKSIDMFLDGEGATARDAVHVIFAGERVRADDLAPAPEVTAVARHEAFNVLRLDDLVRMKLTANRRKDQVHIGDMIEIGLVDASWTAKYPPELAARLQHLLDTPDG
jgi:hypothetical protein